jgi:NIMA-interacting peptidyl-prolyl cis-trans isomerase 1
MSSEPEQVRASHILVKHIGSRNPSSWRERTIIRSKEQALKRLAELKAKIDNGEATFEDVAKTDSDCGSAKNGGDLGFFARGDMLKEFSDTR